MLGPNATHPAATASAVTPNDDTVLRNVRGLYIGGSGNLSVVMPAGNTVTFSAVSAGMLLPIQVSRVRATGTTATDIVALG